MLPALVLPFHDPKGLYFPHLEVITPQLKDVFSCAFISVSPATQLAQQDCIEKLKRDNFFNLNFNEPDTLAGDHYRSAYRNAVDSCSPGQTLHLCDIDKVAFALHSECREQFLADIQTASVGAKPVLFQRTPIAWSSYPKNYREIEHLAIKLGEFLFGKYIDVAWSHLVIQASQLQAILPYLKSRDFGILAEVVLLLKETLITKDVDWLSWEDPFIYSRSSEELMWERDNSIEETQKRLRWLKPIMQVLLESIEN
jgi:hypothetical protein